MASFATLAGPYESSNQSEEYDVEPDEVFEADATEEAAIDELVDDAAAAAGTPRQRESWADIQERAEMDLDDAQPGGAGCGRAEAIR